MEQVYRNSYCNIAAADAENGAGGLFRQREARTVMPPVLELDDPSHILGRQKWVVLRADMWDHGLLERPLYKRGWVYQGQYSHLSLRADLTNFRAYACTQDITLQ